MGMIDNYVGKFFIIGDLYKQLNLLKQTKLYQFRKRKKIREDIESIENKMYNVPLMELMDLFIDFIIGLNNKSIETKYLKFISIIRDVTTSHKALIVHLEDSGATIDYFPLQKRIAIHTPSILFDVYSNTNLYGLKKQIYTYIEKDIRDILRHTIVNILNNLNDESSPRE